MVRIATNKAAIALFWITTSIVSGTQAAAAPPPEAYGRLPAIDDVQISPDGEYLAMIRPYRDGTAVSFHEVGVEPDGPPDAFVPSEGKIRSVRWIGDDRLLVRFSVTHKTHADKFLRTFEFVRAVAMNPQALEQVYLLDRDTFNYAVGAGRIVSLLPDNPDHILVSHVDAMAGVRRGPAVDTRIRGRNDPGEPPVNLYRINIYTGEDERIEKGNTETWTYVVDDTGQVRIRIDFDSVTGTEIPYYRTNSGEFERLLDPEDEAHSRIESFVGFGENPDVGYVLARSDSGTLGLYRFGMADRRVLDRAIGSDEYDLDRALSDPHTHRIVGAALTKHLPAQQYFDERMAGLKESLDRVFEGYAVEIISSNRDGTRHVLLLRSPREPGVYMLLDTEQQQAHEIGAAYPELKPTDLGEVRPIEYEAGDGLSIPAYLTLPPGDSAGKLPLVLLPHSGPEERDSQEFDWMAQYFAGRGYAVLQPNYRGSDGFGLDFRDAGHGEFGRKMQHDLSRGVEHLVDEGIIDPQRVCIVGVSYGGYAALAGAVLTPELYACAISVAGISDVGEFLGSVYSGAGFDDDDYSLNYWEDWMGDRLSDPDELDAISPAKHAGEIRCPVLLIHGRDDTIVQYEQSSTMAAALRKAKKQYKLVSLKGEDHWLTYSASRVRVLDEAGAFLAQHLGE